MNKYIKFIDLLMLALMIVSLPSLEAPKNIFLLAYLITRVSTELLAFKKGMRKWNKWDKVFLTIVCSALLSTLFPGMPNLEEWRGYKVLLTAILTGWLLSRANYTLKNYYLLFKLIVFSALPPLFFAFYQVLILKSKSFLELHSVGHVNHSAIYLTMIFGASIGWLLSKIDSNKLNFNLKKINLFLIGFISLVLFFSLIFGQSRAALGIGTILALCLIFVIIKNKEFRIYSLITLAAIFVISIFFNATVVTKQIESQKKNNVLASRDLVWNVSIEAARFSPILGIGMSNWHFITLEQLKKSVEKRNVVFESKNYFFPGHSHSLYLTALVERGLVGLIVTLIFMFAWIKQLAYSLLWAKKTRLGICLWAGSFSAWMATFGIGLVNTTFHHEHAILACLFLGLYLSFANKFMDIKKIS